MPWTCKVCHTSYDAPHNPTGLACYKTAECKAKKNYACTWTAPAAAVAVPTVEEQAGALGYPNRYNSHTDKFPGGHKTSVMFINARADQGISLDGSTHSGDREGWKGFLKNSSGWVYQGSFQMNLQPWDFRVNDAQVPFPHGTA